MFALKTTNIFSISKQSVMKGTSMFILVIAKNNEFFMH